MNLIVFCITLAAVIAPCVSLTCHSCGYLIGVGDYDCDDPYVKNTGNVTCDDSWYCKKGTISSGSTITALSRTCEPECSTGCIDFLGSTLCGYCCRTDFCNSATNVQISVVTIIATLLLSLGLLYK
ncbi:U-scoloptoxin(05)-Sa1a-like [Lytechinus variegatus]|uniref:U-scoloptoxin(05)-Sa1a-like n=1 Tax=Lytechinus variegatus TaxID=7654 RepID=UPI001BB1560A|nr:U-scoloptoxin(05)-Sa1a-like [Lytechinus variegatus]